jgi:DNA replication protein DnaC
LTNLYADNKHEGTNCCIQCKTEIKRYYIPPFKKYVIAGACKCDADRMEREEQERIRKNRKANLEKTYTQNIMSETLKVATFNSFIEREGTEEILKASKSFAEEFESRTVGLMFYGIPGNGKSHLAAAIHHELDRQGFVSLFLDCSQLFNLAKGTFHRNSKSTLTDIINGAISCDLLTLDELGSGFITEYEFNDILFPIINGRQGKKTNYTTNLDIHRLKRWFEKDKQGNSVDVDGRLLDRILGSTDIYENKSKSKRLEDAKKRMEG